MKKAQAIELVIFKFRPDIAEQEALETFKSLNVILQGYKGFIRREFANSPEGCWMDMVYWETMEDATFAAEDIMKNPAALQLFGAMDEKQMSCYHFAPVAEFTNAEKVA